MKNTIEEPGSPIKICVVLDHKILMWGVNRLIEGNSSKLVVVGTATQKPEALKLINELKPDIIVLGLRLGGHCTARILPEFLANGVSRAVILAADDDNEKIDLAVRNGARGILDKDVTIDQVLKAIATVHRGEFWLSAAITSRVFGPMIGARHDAQLCETPGKHATLTRRERSVVEAAFKSGGSSNSAVAKKLFISEHTLRNHLTSIYRKLDVTNRMEMYIYAAQNRLVQ